MSNLGFAASFLGTIAILVPAGWHHSDADIQGDGKKVRPMQQSFVVDGVRVTLEVDRNLIETGDKVKAKLVAFSDKPKQVAVDLTVQHTRNYEGERVEPVATTIDIEKLTLDAAPGGGKPVETFLRLGEHVDRKAMTDTFRIYAAKKGVRPSKDMYEGVGEGEGEDAPHDAAAVTVMGWSGNNLQLSMHAEGKPRAGEPFVVAVRVKNTTHKKVTGLWVNLGTQVTGFGSLEAGDDFEITRIDEHGDDNEDFDRVIKAGGDEVVRFQVTPKRAAARDVTFVASAMSTNADIGPVVAGAIDARTVKLADGSAVAAK